jgi:hypothetical protein
MGPTIRPPPLPLQQGEYLLQEPEIVTISRFGNRPSCPPNPNSQCGIVATINTTKEVREREGVVLHSHVEMAVTTIRILILILIGASHLSFFFQIEGVSYCSFSSHHPNSFQFYVSTIKCSSLFVKGDSQLLLLSGTVLTFLGMFHALNITFYFYQLRF